MRTAGFSNEPGTPGVAAPELAPVYAAAALSADQLYGLTGLVAVVAVAAYLLRRRWLGDRWLARSE